jgi:hypothetical protein
MDGWVGGWVGVVVWVCVRARNNNFASFYDFSIELWKIYEVTSVVKLILDQK